MNRDGRIEVDFATDWDQYSQAWKTSMQHLYWYKESPVFDYNKDGEVDDGDKVNDEPPAGELFEDGLPAAPAILGNYVYTPGTQTDGDDKPIVKRLILPLPSADTGRLSWEELLIE